MTQCISARDNNIKQFVSGTNFRTKFTYEAIVLIILCEHISNI